MRIGILGSGDVGQSLARGFLSIGHEVMIGSRTPNSEVLTAWLVKAGKDAYTGTFAEASAFGGVVVLATNWQGTANALTLADAPRNLGGKIVIDVTNPLTFNKDGLPELALGHTDSGGEQVQRWLPRSRVVKAFNIISNAYMANPQLPEPPTMFICGNEEKAKDYVKSLCLEFGWKDVVDIGGIEGSRLTEPMCVLWVASGHALGTWKLGFRLVRG